MNFAADNEGNFVVSRLTDRLKSIGIAVTQIAMSVRPSPNISRTGISATMPNTLPAVDVSSAER